VRLEGIGQLKNPMTSKGIEIATIGLERSARTNYATACPEPNGVSQNNFMEQNSFKENNRSTTYSHHIAPPFADAVYSLPCSRSVQTGFFPAVDAHHATASLSHPFSYFGYVVVTAAVTKSAIFWVLTPCNVKKAQRFGGGYHLYLQNRKEGRARNQQMAASFTLVTLRA
jgi:hypothetical protein